MPTKRTPEVCKGALSSLQIRTDKKMCVRKLLHWRKNHPNGLKEIVPGIHLASSRAWEGAYSHLFLPVSRGESLINLRESTSPTKLTIIYWIIDLKKYIEKKSC